MAVNRSQLLAVLKGQIEAIDEGERMPGYHKELLSTLADILTYESAHQTKKTDIVIDMRGKCEALGEALLKAGWKPK